MWWRWNCGKNMIHRWPYLILFLLGLIGCLFIGIQYDPEFHEPSDFIKASPSLQVHYYSPLGESDFQLGSLPAVQQRQELAYRDVQSGKNVNQSLSALQPFSIQLIVVLLIIGSAGTFLNPRKNPVLQYLLFCFLGLVLQFLFRILWRGLPQDLSGILGICFIAANFKLLLAVTRSSITSKTT